MENESKDIQSHDGTDVYAIALTSFLLLLPLITLMIAAFDGNSIPFIVDEGDYYPFP